MTPLPKRRHSSRRQGKRAAAIRLTLPGLLACPHCGSMKLPHRACRNCGYYSGRAVVIKRQKKSKKAKK